MASPANGGGLSRDEQLAIVLQALDGWREKRRRLRQRREAIRGLPPEARAAAAAAFEHDEATIANEGQACFAWLHELEDDEETHHDH